MANTDPRYRETMKLFDSLTAENDMKMYYQRPSRSVFDFAVGDAMVAFAAAQQPAGARAHPDLVQRLQHAGVGAQRQLDTRLAPGGDEGAHHDGHEPLPRARRLLGRGQRGTVGQRRRARLHLAARDRRRLGRGGVPHRRQRRPGRAALLQRGPRRRSQPEVRGDARHGAGLQGARRTARRRRTAVPPEREPADAGADGGGDPPARRPRPRRPHQRARRARSGTSARPRSRSASPSSRRSTAGSPPPARPSRPASGSRPGASPTA